MSTASLPAAPAPLPVESAPRRGCLFYVRRAVLWASTGLLILIVAGVLYQIIGTALDRQSYTPRGQLHTVNGQQIHIVCAGEGSPAVILQAGGAGSSLAWYRVQNQLAAHTRVCAYDRPGHGWSEPADTPRDAYTLAAELRALLEQAAVPPPYVMVGHSFGALWARIYAARYPEDTAGVVLVDSTFLFPDSFSSQSEFETWKDSNDALKAVEWVLYRVGLVRLLGTSGFLASGYPPEIATELTALQTSNAVFDADYAEQIATRQVLVEAAASAEELGSLPLAVLWASRSAVAQSLFDPQRAETATYSTNVTVRMIDGADHGSILGSEPYAAQVTGAVLDVIESAATGVPLADLGG